MDMVEYRKALALEERYAANVINRLSPFVRVAQPQEYANWLKGWVSQGGAVKYIRNYPMARNGTWFVALTSIVIEPLYGTDAISIIFPEGVHDAGGDTGHNDLFIYDKGRCLYRGFHDNTSHADSVRACISAYTDTPFMES
jgi:hypothetical protein